MARLYDRFLAEGHTAVFKGHPVPATNGLRRMALDAHIVVADDVAEFFFVKNRKEVWESSDFPAVAPPLLPMWLEFRAPQWIHSDATGEFQWVERRREKSWAFLFVPGDSFGPRLPMDNGGPLAAAALFADYRRDSTGGPVGPTGPLIYYAVSLNRDGTLPPRPPDVPPGSWAMYLTQHASPSDIETFGRANEPLLDAAWLALSFMHCKNVERRAVDQPAPLSKKWEKKHGRPLVRYEVLDIDPMKKTLESEGGASTHGLKKALHICRGHFATYTEDAPLFGKITGTFWKPQHVRGSAKSGAVVKDYNVKGPDR